MLWTIACSGTEKLLSTWGIISVKRKLVSQAIDELTFRTDGSLCDAPTLFTPFGPSVTLYRNRTQNSDGSFSAGTPWFQGIFTQVPRAGSPDAESMQYKIAGPWWYLDNLVFQQTYENIFLGFATGGIATFGTGKSSHLFLNQGVPQVGSALVKINSGQQITEALNWCLAPFGGTNPPFQIGTVTPAVDVPIDEVRDITCAEVIRKMLRWSPDAVTWFDYTTSPPTFNCKRRADMATINMDASST